MTSYFIGDGWGRHDKGEVKLPLKAFGHDLEVKHAEKAAPVAAAKVSRRFLFIGESGVGEFQFKERLAQIVEIVLTLGVHGGPHDRGGSLIPRQSRYFGIYSNEGIADRGNTGFLNTGDDIAYL